MERLNNNIDCTEYRDNRYEKVFHFGASSLEDDHKYYQKDCSREATWSQYDGLGCEPKGNRWCCLVRFLQLSLLLLLLYVFYTLFLLKAPLRSTRQGPKYLPESLKVNNRRTLGSRVDQELDNYYLDSELLGMTVKPSWARVQYAPHAMCIGPTSSLPKLIILVHSRPGNLIQRNIIRETWGSINNIQDGIPVELLFVIGRLDLYNYVDEETYHRDTEINRNNVNADKSARRNEVLDDLVYGEAVRHQDILIGYFLDTYHNLTIKHELALRWTTENCPQASMILKADDDAFVDIYGLFGYLNRTLDTAFPRSLLACDIIPEGTSPQRSGKWEVSWEQYQSDRYPQYCSGLSYIMSRDVAKSLIERSRIDKWLWIDDVWMTGILAEKLTNLTRIHLNARYCYELNPIETWLERAVATSPPICMVAHLDASKANYVQTAKKLWAHVSSDR
uniref:Hexosyltransferase n=1 Tax=Hirondellea gigas TaxID=1518452 RepID=A0A2P2ICA5_9CRUS